MRLRDPQKTPSKCRVSWPKNCCKCSRKTPHWRTRSAGCRARSSSWNNTATVRRRRHRRLYSPHTQLQATFVCKPKSFPHWPHWRKWQHLLQTLLESVSLSAFSLYLRVRETICYLMFFKTKSIRQTKTINFYCQSWFWSYLRRSCFTSLTYWIIMRTKDKNWLNLHPHLRV